MDLDYKSITHEQLDSIVTEWVKADEDKRSVFLLTTQLEGVYLRTGNTVKTKVNGLVIKGLVDSMLKEKEVADIICQAAVLYIDITEKNNN